MVQSHLNKTKLAEYLGIDRRVVDKLIEDKIVMPIVVKDITRYIIVKDIFIYLSK